MQRATVLVVDDEQALVEAVRFQLEKAGYLVWSADTGPKALELVRNSPPELILLDINLPGLDGLEVCQALRADGYSQPILLLSARDEEIDRVVGLEVGADDYLTKPFSSRELVARVKAHLRRERRRGETSLLVSQGLKVDLGRRETVLAGQPLELSPREFDLLVVLMRHRGQVLSREQLLEKVWGYDYEGEARVVNVTVGRLRDKLTIDRITTVRGVGYRFEE
ncbi:MAG: response regulator transcription factor [Vulcanimicrobiota bacterium]